MENNNIREPHETIDFFRDKSVFLSGATGLLGKQIVEKLLFSTSVRQIFVLMRRKRNQDINERFKDYLKNQVFQFRLTSTDLAKIRLIEGDIGQPDMGISAIDQQILIKEVNIVIHSAATVKFDEPLTVAMNLNVLATQRMLDLATRMKNLQSFVYVSTAFTNCFTGQLDEEIHKPTIDPHVVLKMMQEQDEKTFNGPTATTIVSPHPNTYTFTKSLSDWLVKERGLNHKLPVAIAKPAIITGPLREPIPGFCDDVTQAVPGLAVGVATGLTRVMNGCPTNQLPIIPVDTVANSVLMIAAKTGLERDFTLKSYGIFNTSNNQVTLGFTMDAGVQMSRKYPLKRALRMPAPVTFVTNSTLFTIFHFFYEQLFVMLADLLLQLSGRKPFLRKITAKASRLQRLFDFFIMRDWKVIGENNMQAFYSLSKKEQEVLNLDAINTIDWSDYFLKYYLCFRKYYFKEEGEEATRTAAARLRKVDLLYNTALLSLFAVLTGACYTVGLLL